MLTFIAIAAITVALFILGGRLAAAGRPRLGEWARALGACVLAFAVHAVHVEENKRAGRSLAASFVILEERIKAGDARAALAIADRGIRSFGGEPAKLTAPAERLWEYSVEVANRKPAGGPEPTRP
jgi:hypothetical protein